MLGVLCAGLLLTGFWSHDARAQVLFFDNFQQFANGTDLSSTSYTPASGPPAASVVTSVQNGAPTITVTNFLGNTWALFDNSVVINKNQYKGILSAVQNNQALQITWNLWIQATNSGPGIFLFSVPVFDPNANFNPPIGFNDTGAIFALTNGTAATEPELIIGNWGPLAGTVMTNSLLLNYPNHTFTYSLNARRWPLFPWGLTSPTSLTPFTSTDSNVLRGRLEIALPSPPCRCKSQRRRPPRPILPT